MKKEREEQKNQIERKHKEVLSNIEEEISERTRELKYNEQKVAFDKERLKQEDEKMIEREKDIEKKEEELKNEKRIIEREKRRLEKERLRIEEDNDNLDVVVNNKINDTIKKHKSQIEAKDKELESLRTQLSALIRELEEIKSFREAYGDDPAVIQKNLKELEASNKNLRDKLANCSDKAEMDLLTDRNRELEASINELRKENCHFYESQEQYTNMEAKYRDLDSKYKALESTCESLKNLLEEKQEELIRLSAPEARLADRDERISSLKKGILVDSKDLIGAGLPNETDEIKWLEGIREKCSSYGISFPKRILYAFHTALKINDWSTITVLAGVSGTGKSELPRLYSAFGGLNFISVAVQPNWDSQESMLGFFNSIDNRFEPEPLLRFLVQCTEDEKYKDYMSIVLLDEMNLAYVEHYFAEFLSKLETRRGLAKKDLPSVEVKLGAGVEPYKLQLARTILWTGTMNQDETTKSLSDKVLDRGLVINFPRPKKLSSRTSMGIISKYIGNNRPMLHKSTWQSWTTHEIEFSDDQMVEIEHFREIVEEINNCLEEVGRALGHRVWQSIEYYIANYPAVRQAKTEAGDELTGDLRVAMKIAFEDQIVQKIMPKLRGIETRGKGRNSLQRIEDLLENEGFENLKDDFEMACEQGYGQFMWSSAKYLNSEDALSSKEIQESNEELN